MATICYNFRALVGLAVAGAVFCAAAATPPSGCFGTYDVNVCYSPWKVVTAEPGYSGVVMRKGPYPNADPVYNTTTGQPVVIGVNHHFGRCSNRDRSEEHTPELQSR